MTTIKKKNLPDDLIRDETYAERSRLADLLAGLTADQWAAPSLCDGWRVREVVAHLTMAYRVSTPAFLIGLARSGFKFNKFANHQAMEDAAKLTDAELLTALRDNLRNPWRPPGGGQIPYPPDRAGIPGLASAWASPGPTDHPR